MEGLQNNRFLGEEKITKLLMKFSIPCILSLLISSLYNIVDQIFIGNSELGYLGNAATTVVFPITIISLAFAWCLGDGTAAYLSICQGKKDTSNSHLCVGNSITITLILSVIVVFLCSLFSNELLYAFGASPSSIVYAKSYFTIILIGIPFSMMMNMMNAIIRADGSPQHSMLSILSGAIVNIILDPLFIFVFKWGIEGAAIATIIGQTVSFFISLNYFSRTKTFKLELKSFIPHFKLLGQAVKLGISTLITQLSIVIISLVCNIMLAKYGMLSKYGPDIPIAVIGIVMKVFTIVMNIVVGIILGGQPILGYNYGAGNFKRVKKTFIIILILTIAVGLVSTILIELYPHIIIGLFGVESVLYTEFAHLTMRIFLSLITFTCVIKVSSIFFQAIGQPIKAIAISLTRDMLFFVPLVIILPIKMNINGILWASPLSDIAGMILTLILVILLFKSLDAKERMYNSQISV